MLSSAPALEVCLSTLPLVIPQRAWAPWKSCVRRSGCSFSVPVSAAYGTNKDIILEVSERHPLENSGNDKWASQQKGHIVSYTQSVWGPTRKWVYLESKRCPFPPHCSQRTKTMRETPSWNFKKRYANLITMDFFFFYSNGAFNKTEIKERTENHKSLSGHVLAFMCNL